MTPAAPQPETAATDPLPESETLRERALAHLQQVERDFRFGSWELDALSGTVYWSDGMFAVMGLAPADYPQNRVPLDYFNQYIAEAPSRAHMDISFAKAVEEQRPSYENSQWLRNPAGQLCYFRSKCLLRYDEEGRFLGATGTLTDLTTLQRREESQLLLQARQREVEEKFQFGTWYWEVGSSVVQWSAGLFELLGVEQENHPDGWAPLGFYSSQIPPEEVEMINALVADTIQARRPGYEFEHTLLKPGKPPRRIAVRASIAYDEAGSALNVMGFSADVTASYRHQQELREMQALQHEAEEKFRFGTWRWWPERGESTWSPGMFALLGLNPADYPDGRVPGSMYSHFMKEEEVARTNAVMQEAIRNGLPSYEVEHLMTDGAGQQRCVSLRGRIEYAARQQPGAIIGTCTDITEQWRAQQILKESLEELRRLHAAAEQAKSVLAQFAHSASHDLREPLRRIFSFGERLVEYGETMSTEQRNDHLQRMMTASSRMETLLDGLLEFALATRLQSEPENTDLNEILEEVLIDLDVLIERKKANVQREGAALPTVKAIPVQMRQVFQNLLANALKFSHPARQPEVSIRCCRADGILLEQHGLPPEKPHYLFEVVDNGIGFHPTNAERIFGMFQRLHGRSDYEGTGIGLAICQRIVDNHDGAIFATAEPDKGARFCLLLPA